MASGISQLLHPSIARPSYLCAPGSCIYGWDGALIERSRLLFRPFSALDSLLRLILRIEMAGSLPDDTDDTTTTFISNTKEVVLTLTEAPLRNYIRLYCFVARAARSQSTLLTWTIKRRECPPQGGSSRTLRRLTSVHAHTNGNETR